MLTKLRAYVWRWACDMAIAACVWTETDRVFVDIGRASAELKLRAAFEAEKARLAAKHFELLGRGIRESYAIGFEAGVRYEVAQEGSRAEHVAGPRVH